MRKCKVNGCNGKHEAFGYCSKHYKRFNEFGFIKRTRSDPNKYIFRKDICVMRLYDPKGEYVTSSIFDSEDYPLVSQHLWHVNEKRRPYVRSKTGGWLHRLVMGVQGEIDHVNGNILDDRKTNLRTCTHTQNSCNSKPVRSNSTSGFKGVNMDAEVGKWRARITVNGRRIHLGRFTNPEIAAEAYNIAAERYFGNFARPNNVEANYGYGCP